MANDAMSPSSSAEPSTPWQQRLYDRIWVLAVAAMAFFLVSYVLWGLADLLVFSGG